jgi:hypothetical protein
LPEEKPQSRGGPKGGSKFKGMIPEASLIPGSELKLNKRKVTTPGGTLLKDGVETDAKPFPDSASSAKLENTEATVSPEKEWGFKNKKAIDNLKKKNKRIQGMVRTVQQRETLKGM